MRKHNPGYTLVEMLMATVLTLMMMSAVVQLFESVGKGITASRAMLETNDRLRMAALQLQRDLGGVTVTMLPPRRPENNEGYFEYTEGPIGPVVRPESVFVDADGGAADTTVTDNDDMLMMTVRSEEPFLGRYYNSTSPVQSNYAEVAWFVRGRTLYRRVLLIAPQLSVSGAGVAGFYANNDISARAEGGVPVANTLGDLTKPENRFAHQPTHTGGAAFPSHPHFPIDWSTDSTGRTLVNRTWARLGLPTLRETSHSSWTLGMSLPNSITLTQSGATAAGTYDLWTHPHYWSALDTDTGTLTNYLGSRVGEDVIMTNVIGFDVKAWDPGAPTVMDSTGTVALVPGDPGYLAALRSGNTIVCYGAYVDLNYMCPLRGNVGGNPNYTAASGAPTSLFYGAGNAYSGIRGTEPNRIGTSIPSAATLGDVFTRGNFTADGVFLRDAVYDTWSTHYEYDGIQQYAATADMGTNGLDDDGDGVVDGPSERETVPPYAVPLRGIQVTIRVYEPSTRQVRQRTIQQDFLAK